MGSESLEQHQAHDGQIPRGPKTRPKSCHLVDGQRHYGSFGSLYSQPAQGQPWLADAHRCSLPVGLLKSRSDLTGSTGKGDAQGAIDNGNALVNGGAGQLAKNTAFRWPPRPLSQNIGRL